MRPARNIILFNWLWPLYAIGPKSIFVALDGCNPAKTCCVIRFASQPTVFASERKIDHT